METANCSKNFEDRRQKYSRKVILKPEKDDSELYGEEVVARALSLVSQRQPVQHPPGNGSPEHSDMYSTVADAQLNSGADFCPYHHQQTADSSFYLESDQLNSFQQSFPIPEYCMSEPIINNANHPPYIRSSSAPEDQFFAEPLRERLRLTTPNLQFNCHDNRSSYNSVLENGNFPSSQPVRSNHRNNFDMTGLAYSLTGITKPESFPTKQSTIVFSKKNSPTTSESSDDISFRTVYPSFEPGSESTSSSQPNVNGCGSGQHREVKSVSARVPHTQPRPNGGVTTSTQPYSPTPTPAQTSTKERQPKATVFITYADEPDKDQHIHTVVQISQTLMNNNIDISVDVLEANIQSTSISDWLEERINKCDFVLICISPRYKKVINLEDDGAVDHRSMEKTLNTKYIYRRIHTEYIRNGSKNYRFIPVLLSGGARQHIPHWLCDTKVYQWPDEYEDIIFRLYRMEKYVKPRLGERPRHTVEHYDSLSESGMSNRRHCS